MQRNARYGFFATPRSRSRGPIKKKSSMGRVLRRHKQKLLSSDDDDSPLPPCRADLAFAVLDRFSHRVLYDSGPGLDRRLICGCNELLDSLARSTFWLADGTCTFKVVPSIYFQLYTIHFQFVTGAN